MIECQGCGQKYAERMPSCPKCGLDRPTGDASDPSAEEIEAKKTVARERYVSSKSLLEKQQAAAGDTKRSPLPKLIGVGLLLAAIVGGYLGTKSFFTPEVVKLTLGEPGESTPESMVLDRLKLSGASYVDQVVLVEAYYGGPREGSMGDFTAIKAFTPTAGDFTFRVASRHAPKLAQLEEGDYFSAYATISTTMSGTVLVHVR